MVRHPGSFRSWCQSWKHRLCHSGSSLLPGAAPEYDRFLQPLSLKLLVARLPAADFWSVLIFSLIRYDDPMSHLLPVTVHFLSILSDLATLIALLALFTPALSPSSEISYFRCRNAPSMIRFQRTSSNGDGPKSVLALDKVSSLPKPTVSSAIHCEAYDSYP
jgi:hypothetical protein